MDTPNPKNDFTPEDLKIRALHYQAKTEVTKEAVRDAFKRATIIIIAKLKKDGASRSVRRAVMLDLRKSREELEALLSQPGAYEDLLDTGLSLGTLPAAVPPPTPSSEASAHNG